MTEIEEAESLYYACCDRIDENIDVAEPFLVACIAFVRRKNVGKSSRQKIKEYIKDGFFTPYLRELRFIGEINDCSFKALMTSSLDFSIVLKQVEVMKRYAGESDFELVEPSTHRNKARMAAEILLELSDNMKPTTKPREKHSLFEECE